MRQLNGNTKRQCAAKLSRIYLTSWNSLWTFYPGRGWIMEPTQRRPAQSAAPPPSPPPPPQPAPQANAPTPFKTMFDGTASKLAFFMNR
ncbi:hypothetical protein E2320_000083, partial [Naja naja]